MSSSQQMPLLPCDKYGYCPGFCKKSHSLSYVVEPLSVQNPASKYVTSHRCFSTLTVSVGLKDGQMC